MRTMRTVNSGRFKKGRAPWNKGKKMSDEVRAKCAATMFKKGVSAHNKAEIGAEAETKAGYLRVKVADPNKWEFKHRLVWIRANGVIPKGWNVQFRNGDTHDCRIENLYIIRRDKQLGEENSIHAKYPEDLRKLMQLKGLLKRQINKHNKK